VLQTETHVVFHELRNTLSAVILNLEMGVEHGADPDFARCVTADALSEARRLVVELQTFRELVLNKKGGMQ
jgi:hypothetical protein